MSESAPGESAGDSTHSKDIFTSVECPTCGRDDFKSNRGMRRHHAIEHGESLSEVGRQCQQCGNSFTIPIAWLRKDSNTGKYCSKGCRKAGCGVGVEKEYELRECKSPDCTETFEIPPHKDKRFCSTECAYGNRGVDKSDTKNCKICGDEFATGGPSKADRRKTCSKECFSEWLSLKYTGENSPTWKGGYDPYYGPNWTEQRDKTRERDDYQCQVCGVRESDLERELSVHHIIPFRKFDDCKQANDLDNLISMCEPCHSKWEGLYLRPDTR